MTHQTTVLWRHPSSRAHEYNTLEYWTDLAQLLERGGFDTLFIADVVGMYDVYRGSAEAALRDAAEAEGRPRDSIKILSMLTVITAATDEEAQAKADEYRSYISLRPRARRSSADGAVLRSAHHSEQQGDHGDECFHGGDRSGAASLSVRSSRRCAGI